MTVTFGLKLLFFGLVGGSGCCSSQQQRRKKFQKCKTADRASDQREHFVIIISGVREVLLIENEIIIGSRSVELVG